MVSFGAVFNDQIRRVARRELRDLKRLVAQQRRAIAAIKREGRSLVRQVKSLEKSLASVRNSGPVVAASAETGDLKGFRFRADGFKSHRLKLGLSAADYGKLLGVSELSVYKWESGKARPRKGYHAAIATVRGLGKREALARLGVGPKSAAKPAKQKGVRRGRGAYAQTAVEWITAFLKSHSKATTAQINEAWKKAGRGKTADTTLGVMVQRGDVKRKAATGDQRGSIYSL